MWPSKETLELLSPATGFEWFLREPYGVANTYVGRRRASTVRTNIRVSEIVEEYGDNKVQL